MRPWLTVLKKRRQEQDWVFLRLQLRRRCVCLCVFVVAAVWLVVNQNVNCWWLHVERIPVFSLPFGRCCVEIHLMLVLCPNNSDHSTVHGHPLHGWLLDLWMTTDSEIQCHNLDLLMVCTAPFVFVLCGPIYAMCFP